jgi:hypothetical protein
MLDAAHHAASPSTLPAVTLLALLAGVTAALALARRHPGRRGALLAAAIGGLVFQAVHVVEHGLQAGYWALHPSEPPWMTPWAHTFAASFGTLAPGTPSFGMEALHLVGNAIFLAGVTAVSAALARSARPAGQRAARTALWVQRAHVAEHVVLTATVVLTGRAIGVSTLFGALDPGPALWTYRVWWHLAINVAATSAVVVALQRHRRHRPAPSYARDALVAS